MFKPGILMEHRKGTFFNVINKLNAENRQRETILIECGVLGNLLVQWKKGEWHETWFEALKLNNFFMDKK